MSAKFFRTFLPNMVKVVFWFDKWPADIVVVCVTRHRVCVLRSGGRAIHFHCSSDTYGGHWENSLQSDRPGSDHANVILKLIQMDVFAMN